MSGVKGRSGRQPKWHEYAMDEVANLTFQAAGRLIRDENVPLIDRVRVCLPLALKRIPDRHEVSAITLNMSDENARKMIELAERNLLLRKELVEYKQLGIEGN